MRTPKMWFVSVVGATLAATACLIPPILIVLVGSSALAFVPSWLDFVLVPAFLLFTGSALYFWHRQRRAGDC